MTFTYQETKDLDGKVVSITRLEDMASIPNDPANADYQAYLAYVANGNKVPSNSSTPQAGAN